ncbi:MAG: LysM peptidoglycan-binding domain-containing protein [Chloroflexi bacterium]|nr:LysM peptidoglycan-binding domain-containing protein [Chloroflexota bacterium]
MRPKTFDSPARAGGLCAFVVANSFARLSTAKFQARVGKLCAFVAAILIAFTVSPASADSPTTHTVAWGETLYSIARMYGVPPQSLASANNISLNSWVYAGTRLLIPSGNAPAVASTTPSGYYTVRAGDTLFSIASRFGTTVDTISSANNLPANGVLYVGWTLKIPSANQPTSQPLSRNKPTSITHIVQPGEYLALIALHYGTTTQAIAYANNLAADWMIYATQRLSIPTASSKSPTPSTIAPTSLNLRLTNVPLLQQKQTLTCEEASAAMAARGAITENQLVAVMPRSDNPFNGIRGSTNSPYFGGLYDYGVYAQGLQKGLTALNIRSQILYGQSFDDFKGAVVNHLRANHPIVWWHTWQDSYQVPVMVKMSDGKLVKLVPYEHAGTIVGANDSGVTYHDPYDATVRFISWADFRRVSSYFDNMALVVITNDK